jgi:hypothetical protein
MMRKLGFASLANLTVRVCAEMNDVHARALAQEAGIKDSAPDPYLFISFDGVTIQGMENPR